MKYKAISEQIIADIKSQKLILGQRLPSLRMLTKQFGVSMTTALNSYRSLEQKGWVVAHPKSGFFVSTPTSEGSVPKQPQFKSSSRPVSARLIPSDIQDRDVDSGPFGISQLCPKHLPLLSLKRSIKRTVQRGDEFLHNYSDPQGVFELRQALAKYFNGNGYTVSAEDLFISSGCMDAIRTALLVTTNPGDSVAISSPCFNGLLKLLSSLSRKVRSVPRFLDRSLRSYFH